MNNNYNIDASIGIKFDLSYPPTGNITVQTTRGTITGIQSVLIG